jgi:hypothetical protein
MHVLIRPFLNLSVGRKLALSAALSLCLIALLVLLQRGSLASLDAAKQAQVGTLSALATLFDASGKGREAVATTVRIGTAQTIEAVEAALAATTENAGAALRLAREAAAAPREEATRAAVAALGEPL